MEGNRRRSHTQRHDLLQKIKEFSKSILKDMTERRSLSISINQFRNYCKNLDAHCSCSYDFPQGQEILTLGKQCHARRIDILLSVLLIVQQLLQENIHMSKRDIYYMHPSLYSEQSIVDQAINDICILLQCSRHNLNVVSAGKGNRCIVITGRGYPDISTRRFLRLLIEELRLPTYCLVDCDPYGFDILTTYRFGSMQMAYDAKFLRIPEMHWLGAFPSDFEKYGLPKNCRLKLTAEDTTKTEAMLHRCYLQREVPHWRSELELMLQSGVKFEIEAFCAHSFSFLSEKYIPSKIQEFERLAV